MKSFCVVAAIALGLMVSMGSAYSQPVGPGSGTATGRDVGPGSGTATGRDVGPGSGTATGRCRTITEKTRRNGKVVTVRRRVCD
jgi:hypothetical protein